MKKIILPLSLLIAISAKAQTLLPSFDHIGKAKSKMQVQKTTVYELSADKKLKKLTETIDTIRVKDTLKNRVIFYGLTSLNSASSDLASSITATGRLAVLFSPAPSGIFQLNMGANLLNAKPTKGIKKDSVDFTSLMFPESGNFGFLFNPSLRLGQWWEHDSSRHSLSAEGSFTYRRVSVDSPAVDFKVLTYNLGLKYQWDYKLGGGDNFIFTGMVYWNYFNIPDEDVTKFNALLNDSLFNKVDKTAEISSFGCKLTAQYKNLVFFADLRRNRGTKNLSDDNPFKGTKFNIGFATLIPIKTF